MSAADDPASHRVAVVPARQGRLPVGAAETVANADCRGWVVGSGAHEAATTLAEQLGVPGPTLWAAELGPFAPGRWARWLAPRLADRHAVLLPHSPDGRDLAPWLAAELGRPLVSSALELDGHQALVSVHGGLAMDVVALDGPFVATLQIGGRSAPTGTAAADSGAGSGGATIEIITDTDTDTDTGGELGSAHRGATEAELLEELEPDRATRDLAESSRIVAAGAGLGDREELVVLDAVAAVLEASVGATRVLTDWGWLPADRQIGTTGVMVDPDFYLAVGISGAVQHTAGLGHPRHIVSVNTDPSCPMMELADLALVCDGPAYLQALAEALGLADR